MSELYQSGYAPSGVRKAWDRCSMGCESAGVVLRAKGVPHDWGDPVEAVAWFDGDPLKLMVADYSNGRRVTYRRRSRDQQITFGRAV